MRILKILSVFAYLTPIPSSYAAPTTSESLAPVRPWSLSPQDCSPATCPADARHATPGSISRLEKRAASPGRIADKIREGFQQLGQKIQSGFQAAGQAIKDTEQKAVQGVQDNIVKPIENKIVQPIEQKIVAPIENKVVKPAVDALKKAPAEIKKEVGGSLRKGGQEIKKEVGGNLRKGGQAIKNVVGGNLRKGGEVIKNVVGGNLRKGGEVIKNGLKEAKNKVIGGLQKMGKELGELGRKAREALKPQRRLSDAQRDVVKSVFKFFGEMVGALGCMTAKLIPGANVAVELVCAASAVAETTVDAVQAGQQKQAPQNTKVAEAASHSNKAAQSIAKANDAKKTMGILSKAGQVLKLIRVLPFRKRGWEEPVGPESLMPVEKRGLEETALSAVKPRLQPRNSAGDAPRESLRPRPMRIEALRTRSVLQAPRRRDRLRGRQLRSDHRHVEKLRHWKREAAELFPFDPPLRKRKPRAALLKRGYHQTRKRSAEDGSIEHLTAS